MEKGFRLTRLTHEKLFLVHKALWSKEGKNNERLPRKCISKDVILDLVAGCMFDVLVILIGRSGLA